MRTVRHKPVDTLRDAAEALCAITPPTGDTDPDLLRLAEHFETLSDIDLAVSWLPLLAETLAAVNPDLNRPLLLLLTLVNQRLIDPPENPKAMISVRDLRKVCKPRRTAPTTADDEEKPGREGRAASSNPLAACLRTPDFTPRAGMAATGAASITGSESNG